ncbi:hypothetical protein ACIQWS_07085 [Phyllobacterium sp. NPDC097923]|jgi:hypothetical protein|uniref:hypothetical protein n=1 Tax=Phyllobacterium sp. NPDC097923 TaxID=3364404 RepID=UPI00383BC0AC
MIGNQTFDCRFIPDEWRRMGRLRPSKRRFPWDKDGEPHMDFFLEDFQCAGCGITFTRLCEKHSGLLPTGLVSLKFICYMPRADTFGFYHSAVVAELVDAQR